MSSERFLAPRDLTPRQKEVIAELVLGKSNPEIARALGLSESSVKVHLAEAEYRVGVEGRLRLALWAVANRPRWEKASETLPVQAEGEGI